MNKEPSPVSLTGWGHKVFVFENLPADVCNICYDTLLRPETVRHLEKSIRDKTKPRKLAPLHEYA